MVDFEITPGRYRVIALATGYVLMILTLWRGLPVEAVAAMIVGIGQLLRPSITATRIELRFRLDECRQTWMSKLAIAVVLPRSDPESIRWCFVDELPPEQWSRLRRRLLIHTPRTPWGLSISR